MSKILVTGGLGFIGSNFISKYISKGHFLVNIDSKTYASIDKSLLNFESFENYRHYNVNINDYKNLNEIIKKYSFDKILTSDSRSILNFLMDLLSLLLFISFSVSTIFLVTGFLNRIS